jgi:capsular exopolysaccharide synthesis family protein
MAEQTSSNDLRALAALLRRRAWTIILCAVLLPAAAAGLSLLQNERYSASALLLFQDPEFDQQLFGSSLQPRSRDSDREAATNVRLLSVDEVADRTASFDAIQALLPGITGAGVAEKIVVRPEGQADIASVTAEDGDPRVASSLANVFAEEFIAFRRSADQATIEAAQRTVQRQLDELAGSGPEARERRRSLQERAEDLGIMASLQTGNAELVQRADIPRSPSSPRIARNVVVGAVLGVLLGLVMAFLIDRFDRRFRHPREIEHAFERPLLASIPEQSRDQRTYPVPSSSLEPFRILRSNLRYFNLDRRITSLLITSAEVGDGKSMIAGRLAAAAAAAGDRVLLVDADLRRSTLSGAFRIPGGKPGLSITISSAVPLADAVRPVRLGALVADAADDAELDVLTAGPPAPNPTELLESDRMTELLRTAERTYDLVIVDTPPATVVPDAVPLMRVASGVIVVARLGHSSRDAARHLRKQLDLVAAPTLGVVVNSVPKAAGPYYGGYETEGRENVAGRRASALR